MRADIHPAYADINVTCSCGNEFTTRSTLGKDLRVEICSACHPFYTGTQKSSTPAAAWTNSASATVDHLSRAGNINPS